MLAAGLEQEDWMYVTIIAFRESNVTPEYSIVKSLLMIINAL